MPTDIRKNFHQSLDHVRDDLVRMGGMVTEALGQATEALLAGDLQTAERLIREDDCIDALQIDIEERIYQLFALQQPMATDMRTLVAALRLTAEIERSGDLVVNLMKAMRRIYGVDLDPKVRGLIGKLSEHVHRLFRLAMDSYADRNEGLAAALDDMDDAVDELHKEFIQSIFEVHEGGQLQLQTAVQLALVGRYYERIGDHAVNIGERVRYMVSGWMPEHTGAARHAATQAAETTGADAVAEDAASDET